MGKSGTTRFFIFIDTDMQVVCVRTAKKTGKALANAEELVTQP